MAPNSLTEAVAAIRAAHGPQIKITFFKDNLGDDVTHFQVFDDDVGVTGFGSDSQPDKALAKAYSEHVERRVVKVLVASGNTRSSNGFAAHLSPDLARQAAVSELVERDLFMSTWLAQRPPAWLSPGLIDSLISAEAKRHLSVFGSHGIEVSLGLLGRCEGRLAMVGCIDGSKSSFGEFGASIATAAGSSISVAVDSILRVLRRAASEVKSRSENYLALFSEMAADEVKSPIDHRTFFLNPANVVSLAWYLEDSSVDMPDTASLPVQCDIVPTNFVTAWPIFVAWARSAECQQYFSGPTKDEHVNFQRLKRLGIDASAIYRGIHPLP